MSEVYNITPELRIEALKGTRVYCNICDTSFLSFLPFGTIMRPNAECLQCHSLERHRMIWSFLCKMELFKDNNSKKILHVAPESYLFKKFTIDPLVDYYPIDKFDEGYEYESGTVNMDATNLLFEDSYFDFLFCSHVLEHIPDDHKAMTEFYRVLKKGAKAILQVPINYNTKDTAEDLTITDPETRQRLYGRHDHVRYYGYEDYQYRLENAGFKVQRVDYINEFNRNDRVKYGLPSYKDDIFICTK